MSPVFFFKIRVRIIRRAHYGRKRREFEKLIRGRKGKYGTTRR